MDAPSFVRQRVRAYYWDQNLNCATATLKILSERFGVDLRDQVIDAALGMHGAGGYRAQCGLVEGALMFVGIIGRARGLSDAGTVAACREYARQFEARFGSLSCSVLRPRGFRPDDPPHLCEPLTCEAIVSDVEFIDGLLAAHDAGPSR